MPPPKNITAQELYEKLRHIKLGASCCQYSLKKCEEFIPLINKINRLKSEQNAVILAHTYVTPEIMYGVADHVGDSYGLSKKACETSAQKIVFAAVRFMGETAKILNPEKEVLVPARDAGCTLADSINAEQVRELRKQFPDYAFICYVNTTVDVKAECDVCVTSSNVYNIVASIPNNKIYFLPDQYMGQNLIFEMNRRGVTKDIRYYNGSCIVHEKIPVEEIDRIRQEYPDVVVVAHPECKPEVCQKSNFIGSTAQMFTFIKNSTAKDFLMLTECGLGHRIKVENPEKNLVGTCRICDFMKSNSLEDIYRVMTNPSETERITIDEPLRLKALKSIEAMFQYSD